MIDGDRWLRRLWLVNGILLLALMLFGGGSIVYLLISSNRGGGEDVALGRGAGADSANLKPRAVRYSAPRTIRGTATQMAMVYHGTASMIGQVEGYSGSAARAIGSGDSYGSGPLVNVLFLKPDGTGALLFHQPVLVKELHYREMDDTTFRKQAWIAYEVVTKDSNGNDRLDEKDRPELYVSDLDGNGLRPVLGPRLRVDEATPLGDGSRMLVYALEESGKSEGEAPERMRQRAFVYEPDRQALTRYTVLDSLTRDAARILAK